MTTRDKHTARKAVNAPAQGKDRHRGRIVVGVDGSAESRAALAWAVGQATMTGAAVEAVTAWDFPVVLPTPWPPGLGKDWHGAAERVAADAVTAVSEADSTVRIRPKVAEGNAAQVLLDAAKGADLLVLGSRVHGRLAGGLLGSVSMNCVHHASCPVVVVRG